MKDLGKGIATVGIWVGVGLVGWNGGEVVMMVGFFAAFATAAVWVRR